jgi:hypothetical protein
MMQMKTIANHAKPQACYTVRSLITNACMVGTPLS